MVWLGGEKSCSLTFLVRATIGSTRLCNFYLVDDQVLAGQGLVWLSALIPALWLGWQLGVRGGWQRLL